jgi:hypothetical protein
VAFANCVLPVWYFAYVKITGPKFANNTDFPRPSWRPDFVRDIEKVKRALRVYTNNEKPFVVYQNGTGVFPSKISPNEESDAGELFTPEAFDFRKHHASLFALGH